MQTLQYAVISNAENEETFFNVSISQKVSDFKHNYIDLYAKPKDRSWLTQIIDFQGNNHRSPVFIVKR